MAFAAAVFQGQIKLSECPFIDEDLIQKYGNKKMFLESKIEQDYQEKLILLNKKLAKVDLKSKADNLSGYFSNDKLTLNIFGKAFSIDIQGKISTDIHINGWITSPVLSYIVNSKGLALTNRANACKYSDFPIALRI